MVASSVITDSFLEKVFIVGSSPAQLEECERSMKKFRPYLEAHYLLGESEIWPFRPQSLDLVVSNLNLHLSNDIGASLSRILESL